MNIVIDSNILFSGLIKDSFTRRLILEFKGFFLFPSYIFQEFSKHKGEILKKSSMKENDFDELFGILLSKVSIIPDSSLLLHRKEALEIIGGLDRDDAIFIACCLAYDAILWSDDKKLKKQDRILVLNTFEFSTLIRYF